MTEQNARTNIRIYVRKLVVILVLLCMTSIVGYAKPNKVDSLSVRMVNVERVLDAERREIAILQNEIGVCEKSLRNIDEHVDRANEEISNQIAASSHTIQVWGWIIAILAIGVSVAGVWYARYINNMRKDITHLLSDALKQLEQAETASDDISEQQQRISAQQQEIKGIQETTETKVQELQSLYSDIQNNMNAIYAQLRREETNSLLKRLVDVPEDIANVGRILLARTLEKEDFPQLLTAYHNLISRCLELSGINDIVELRKKNPNFLNREESYAIQFAQHFMDKSVLVPEIRELLRPRFESFFNVCFFRNDAEKCTIDFKQGINSLGEEEQIDLLADYICAMSQSNYAIFTDWYKLLLSNLSEQQLGEIWDRVTKRSNEAYSFAATIKEVVADINPHSALLEDIEAYMKQATRAND